MGLPCFGLARVCLGAWVCLGLAFLGLAWIRGFGFALDWVGLGLLWIGWARVGRGFALLGFAWNWLGLGSPWIGLAWVCLGLGWLGFTLGLGFAYGWVCL